MVQAEPRTVTALLRNPKIRKDVAVAIDELDRLVKYYESEIKQRTIEVQQLKAEGNLKDMAFAEGLIVAYQDHIEEILYIEHTIRGLNREMEEILDEKD